MKNYLIASTIASLLFGLPLSAIAAASTAQVVISEVAWAGSASSNADEYLELQNLEGKSIDLGGWSIEGAGVSGAALTLPSGATITAGGVYLISNYDAVHSTLSVTPDLVTTTISLSNSALKLVLKDASGVIADTVGEGKTPTAGSSKVPFASMIHTSDGWATASTTKNFDTESDQLGTPGIADLAVAVPEVVIVPISEPAVDLAVDSETSPVEEVVSITTEEANIADIVEQAVLEEFEATEVLVDNAPEDEPAVEAPIENAPIDEVSTTASYAIGDLLINEVVSNPESGNEWVEIYNPYDNVIPLDDWKLTEAGGTSVSLQGLIGEESLIVVEFKNKLNNGGDTVMLSDPSGAIIDDVRFGAEGSVEAPSKGESIARDDQNDFAITLTPTRGEENQINEPVVEEKVTTKTNTTEKTVNASAATDQPTNNCSLADGLTIIKLFPDPTTDEETDEFIALENVSDETLCLDGWTLSDAVKTYKLEGTLGAHLRLELPRPVTKIALNNTSGEEVNLANSAGEIINKITYEKAEEDAIYTLLDGQWQWQSVRVGAEQAPVQCDDTESGSDAEVEGGDGSTSDVTKTPKKTSTESRTLEGVVIATPGTFGDQIMYVDGLQLYQYSGDFPAVEVGDVVRVSGVPSTSHGEARLKVASADKVVVVGKESAEPEEITLNEATGAIGRLVKVEGVVTRRSGDRLTLEKNGDVITVIAKDGTDVSFSGMVLGTTLAVTGVVSTYDGSTRLLPRSTEDIETTEQVSASDGPADTRPSGAPTAGIGLAGITTSAVGARAWWHRRKKKQI